MMDYSPATPVVALVEPQDHLALPVAGVLEAAGYVVVWYRAAADVLKDALEVGPTVAILAGTRPTHFDQWHAARELRDLDCAVIMATADAAARREVYTTSRGGAFVGSLRVPYDLAEVVVTVRQALHDYPANLRERATVAQAVQHARQGWRGVLLQLQGRLHDPAKGTQLR